MKRILVVVAVMTMSALMVPAASATPAGFSIKGSSSTFDVGHPFEGERTSSVNVRQQADGSFKGHVNITVTITPNGSTYSKTHGDVVCIEPTSCVSGGDGYKVRYVVTKASGGGCCSGRAIRQHLCSRRCRRRPDRPGLPGRQLARRQLRPERRLCGLGRLSKGRPQGLRRPQLIQPIVDSSLEMGPPHGGPISLFWAL